MQGTRSMTVALLALVGVFLCAAVYVATQGREHAPIGSRALSAAAFMSVTDEAVMGPVIVDEDDTRVRMGLRLRDALRGEMARGTYENAPSITLPDTAIQKEDAQSVSSQDSDDTGCIPYRSFLSGSWGQVMVVTDGTRRILTSSIRADDGLPLHERIVPKTPVRTERPTCVAQGGIALMLDGTVLMQGQTVATPHDGLIGFAIDGFPVLGNIEDEKVVASSLLDQCHGHTHTIMLDEAYVPYYHYHLTDDAAGLECIYGVPPR